MTDPKKILLGRLEALGPVIADRRDEPLLLELERDGAILRTRLNGQTHWCERRLLARIHRYTLERLRREIEPVSASEFLQFLACWQHVDPAYQLEGPRGVTEALRQLAGFEVPASAWEAHVLARRVRDYRREWLDEVTLSGEFAWGRLWGASSSAIRITPITFVPRDELDEWLTMAGSSSTEGLCGAAADLLKPLSARGAMFPQEIQKAAGLVTAHVEMGLAELVSRGLITCDSFGALRQMITPPSKRRRPLRAVGRWSCLRGAAESGPSLRSTALTTGLPSPRIQGEGEASVERVAKHLLRRTGVVFRRTIMREKIPITWLALSRAYRRMELRGEVRGGRFVAGFAGEQFALPEAVELLRRLRREGTRGEPITVASADPLNFQGILTPQERVAPTLKRQVPVG
jgi:ATP-dependent Lhr-like helicase